MSTPLHLAVALDGAGWHPAAWRTANARPDALSTPGYWVDLVLSAERGLIDFVTIEDALAVQSSRLDGPDGRTDRVVGRLDAVLIAARVAPVTRHIGLVPTATVTHTEPFHISKAIATLDYVATGRGGWRAQVSARSSEAGHFGRREVPALRTLDEDPDSLERLVRTLFDEAGDFVEVVRRLWDSWEDDAEIRDAATGRFVDRAKLHYIDFEGPHFSVRGPSITPRPPQGQPVVTALAHAAVPRQFGAEHADVVFVTPHDSAEASADVADVRGKARDAGRDPDQVHVFGDLVVLLGPDEATAQARLAELDGWSGEALTSDAEIFVGTAAALADLLQERQSAGLTGFRLRPAVLPDDLDAIVGELVPELQRRSAFRTTYADETLRGRLGLQRPANRYVAV